MVVAERGRLTTAVPAETSLDCAQVSLRTRRDLRANHGNAIMTRPDDVQPDWDPTSPEVLQDQSAAYDAMRERCPVAYNDRMGWTLFRHADVIRALHDHETFSNAVSQHLNVPSGMDPPQHTAYRRIIEPYFSGARMSAFEPACRAIASGLLKEALALRELEIMQGLALPFAVQCQCAFLGWPEALHGQLVSWMRRNQEATLKNDRQATSAVAQEFTAIVDEQIEARLQSGTGPDTDVTASLMDEMVQGRPLTKDEIASVLRNWTAGEIGTLASSIGILAAFLAEHSEIQERLRNQPGTIPAAVEEILRIRGPLVSNRRITTKPVEIGGRKIEAGVRVSLNWIAANRDEDAFENASAFCLDRDREQSLLWGAGIHICPGAPLAQLELRVFLEELLARTTEICFLRGKAPENAVYPASGFATVPLCLVPGTGSKAG